MGRPTAPDGTASRRGGGGGPQRLRDLDRTGRLIAVAVVAALLAPFVVALVRAFSDGWVLSGDEALIAIRARDVFGGALPLVGQPSTSGLYGAGIATYHPGPIEFYLLAVPLRLLGHTTGPLLFAAAVNGGAVLVAAWVAFRRGGPGVGLWAAVVLATVTWSTGTAVLTDTISSNMAGYSLLAAAFLLWAVADGDVALLPLAAFVASYAAQQHMAVVGLTGVLVGAALTALVARTVVQFRGARHRRNDVDAPTTRPGGCAATTDLTSIRRSLGWAAAAAVVGLTAWVPVIVDQLTGRPGNLTAAVRFARDSGRPTLGRTSGAYQALRSIAFPPLMTRTDVGGGELATRFTTAGMIGAWTAVIALVAVVVLAARRRPALATLAGTALVVALAGGITGANVPASIESLRVNLYRWMWAAAAGAWLALGWGAALLVSELVSRRRARASHARPRPITPMWAPAPLLAALVLVVAAVATVRGPDDRHRDVAAFDAERSLATTVLSRVPDDGPLLLLADGLMADGTVGPSLAYRLVEDGRTIEVPADKTPYYGGDERSFNPRDVAGALVLTSRGGALPAVPGRLIAEASLDPAFASLLARLTATARGRPVVVSPRGELLLDALGAGRPLVQSLIDGLPTDPERSLGDETFLDLVSRGLLSAPRFDPTIVGQLQALLPRRRQVLGEDRIAVHLLTAAELRAYRPDLFG